MPEDERKERKEGGGREEEGRSKGGGKREKRREKEGRRTVEKEGGRLDRMTRWEEGRTMGERENPKTPQWPPTLAVAMCSET